jgi:hypothetical protein
MASRFANAALLMWTATHAEVRVALFLLLLVLVSFNIPLANVICWVSIPLLFVCSVCSAAGDCICNGNWTGPSCSDVAPKIIYVPVNVTVYVPVNVTVYVPVNVTVYVPVEKQGLQSLVLCAVVYAKPYVWFCFLDVVIQTWSSTTTGFLVFSVGLLLTNIGACFYFRKSRSSDNFHSIDISHDPWSPPRASWHTGTAS